MVAPRNQNSIDGLAPGLFSQKPQSGPFSFFYPNGWEGGLFGLGNPLVQSYQQDNRSNQIANTARLEMQQRGLAEGADAQKKAIVTGLLAGPSPYDDPMASAFGGPSIIGTIKPSGKTLQSIVSMLDKIGIDNAIHESNGVVTVSKIVVPKDLRGQGLGTKAMQAIVDYADETGKSIALSPSADFGGSVSRLLNFYRRFGLVPNKGRYKDFSTRETMIRPPKVK